MYNKSLIKSFFSNKIYKQKTYVYGLCLVGESMNQDDNPKIYVMQLKEIIYTAILIVLAIILIIIMINTFAGKEKTTSTSSVPSSSTTATTSSIYSYTYN